MHELALKMLNIHKTGQNLALRADRNLLEASTWNVIGQTRRKAAQEYRYLKTVLIGLSKIQIVASINRVILSRLDPK